MQSRKRSPSPKSTAGLTGSFRRRPLLRSPPIPRAPGEPALKDDAIFERHGLQSQVTVAAVFVAVSAGMFFAALRRTFEIMP